MSTVSTPPARVSAALLFGLSVLAGLSMLVFLVGTATGILAGRG